MTKKLSFLCIASALLASLTVVPTPAPAGASPAPARTTGIASVGAGAQPAVVDRNTSVQRTFISGNGRFVAFDSSAQLTSLTHGPTPMVYVKDLLTEQVEVISATPTGGAPNGQSSVQAISKDGRYVAFASFATNLVDTPTNATLQIYLRDRTLRTTSIISTNTAGSAGNVQSPFADKQPSQVDISDDGRYVAFTSRATNLGAGSEVQAYLRDRQAGTTEVISRSTGGSVGTGPTSQVSMDASGRFFAFVSTASNLIGTDTNGTLPDVFVRDRTAGTTQVVGLTTSNAQPSGEGAVSTGNASISDDGTRVAFSTEAKMVAGETDALADVFVRNRASGTTTKISVATGGGSADQNSTDPVISGDGTTVVWSSTAGSLVPGGGNGRRHVFSRRLIGLGTGRESISSTAALANQDVGSPSVSTNGAVVAFTSTASNLVPGDADAFSDVFVRRNVEIGPHPNLAGYTAAVVKAFTGANDAAAANAMAARITNGGSAEREVVALANTAAFASRRAPLVRLYYAYFERLPDTGGFTFWLNRLNGGYKLDQASQAFASSNEFKTTYGNTTNAQFVNLVYNNVLKRNPDAAGLSFWVNKLAGGLSRGSVMTNFSESNEGKRTYRPIVDTTLIGLGLLGRIPPKALAESSIVDMAIDSSELGARRLITSPEYDAVVP